MNICRFCEGVHAPLFRFGKRHYAHPECGLRKHGAEFLDKLPAHELAAFPFFIAEKYQVLDRLRELTKALDKQPHAVAK